MWDNEANVSIIYDNEIGRQLINYFWSAPDQYLGNKLTSYGLVLRVSISWNVQRGDTSGKPVFNPDVIIAVVFFPLYHCTVLICYIIFLSIVTNRLRQ